MNILLFYTIAFSWSIILPRAYGRKIHRGHSFYNYKPPSLTGNSKHEIKQLPYVYSGRKTVDYPTQTNHLFRLNAHEQKELQSNQYGSESIVYPPESNKRKTLSTKIGKHLIRITSALQAKQLDVNSNGESEISVNPKFSHVIEILPLDKNDLEHDHHSKNSEDYENFDQKPEAEDTVMQEIPTSNEEKISTVKVPVDEEISTVRAPVEEKISTVSAPIEEDILTVRAPVNEEISAVKFPFDEDILALKAPVDEKIPIVRIPVIDEKIWTEKSLVTDKTVETTIDSNTDETDIDLRSGSQNQESEFNVESEGSGEDFASLSAEEEPSKSGRLLGIFSRQNDTAPSCTTPKGESGQCRRIRQCILSDTLNNFNSFLQQLCLIRGALVGICCPNNPVIEISNPDVENTTDNSTSEVDIKQPPEGCGLNTKTRIVGGSISVPHEWTWMVALLRRNRFYCGGVIINNWYVLTAAHCVMGIDVKDITVRLGEYDFNVQNRHQQDISISDIKRHAQFVTLTFQHDIALLKLKRSIQYSKFVGSICLPNQKARDYSDMNGTVVGWGTVSFGGSASPILRQVTIPVWKNEDCDRTYALETISESFMCAGSPEKGEDACQGDSGGPLMALNERGRWEVIGLVSWGRRCGDPTYPGVYTRVTTYLDWINENVK